MDINITETLKKPNKNLESSELVLFFKGKDVNTTLVNTLRRLAIERIASYAFTKETIKIDKNNSIFNNDYMRLRLSLFMPPNINNDVVCLSDKYWHKVDYADPDREKHEHDTHKVELSINVTNHGNDVLNVTTNHAKYLLNNVEQEWCNPKYPDLVLKLRPNESFICKATAVLGLGLRHNMWSACRNAFYEEKDDGIEFTVRSKDQMEEYVILIKACEYMKEKLTQIKNIPNGSDNIDKEIIIIKLDNENHTIGYIINDYLQEHKDIIYSGCQKPDLLENKIEIKYSTSNKNPITPFIENINHIIKIFDHIQKKLVALKNKTK